jgi:hypothetical protein
LTDKYADIPKGPWDQEKFEDLLAKWIVATDQPFFTVEEPEFRALLAYIHHPSPNLKIPHRDAIRRRIMKMGDDTIQATKQMFMVCNHLLSELRLTILHRQMSMGKLAFRLMHGHRATTSRSWPLSHIT